MFSVLSCLLTNSRVHSELIPTVYAFLIIIYVVIIVILNIKVMHSMSISHSFTTNRSLILVVADKCVSGRLYGPLQTAPRLHTAVHQLSTSWCGSTLQLMKERNNIRVLCTRHSAPELLAALSEQCTEISAPYRRNSFQTKTISKLAC